MKTLEHLLDSKEIKPVNPKGNQPEYSLEGLMLKLKLQYFGHLMQRADSLERTLLLGKIEGRRRRGRQRMRWLDGNLSEPQTIIVITAATINRLSDAQNQWIGMKVGDGTP